MRRREAVLLYLISCQSHNQGKLSKTLLDKQLFLLKKEYDMDSHVKFYNFHPYKFGPFSINFARDLADLQSRGLISLDRRPTPEAAPVIEKLGQEEKGLAERVASRFKSRRQITDYVYAHYPEYTVRSELIEHGQRESEPGFFSIGYEGKDIDQFLDILIRNSIQVVADVRENPFSMKFQFIGSSLKTTLAKVGIGYVHLPELGIPGSKRKNLESEGEYEKLFEEYKRKVENELGDKVLRLIELGKQKRMALLCFEADHTLCHRGVLSSRIERLTSEKVVHL